MGIADRFSDLDAIVWLDDPLWKTHGGQVQLVLQQREQQQKRFAPAEYGYSEIYVWPLRWLGHLREFLESKETLPWEKVKIEEFYELQESLVLQDPDGVFHRLREATAPERFPQWLWRKLLIEELNKLADDILEFRTEAPRRKVIEASIILGSILEDLLHLGFFINRRYYPWRKHLRWAFEKLPVLAPKILRNVDVIASSRRWKEKLASIEAVRDVCLKYIREKHVLPPEVLDDLVWADRFEAWSNPNWRDRIARGEQKAKEAGYDSSYGWIWHLWDWI